MFTVFYVKQINLFVTLRLSRTKRIRIHEFFFFFVVCVIRISCSMLTHRTLPTSNLYFFFFFVNFFPLLHSITTTRTVYDLYSSLAAYVHVRNCTRNIGDRSEIINVRASRGTTILPR